MWSKSASLTEVDAKWHVQNSDFVRSKIADERNFVGGKPGWNPRREKNLGKRFHGSVLDAHRDRYLTRSHFVSGGHGEFSGQWNVFGRQAVVGLDVKAKWNVATGRDDGANPRSVGWPSSLRGRGVSNEALAWGLARR